jgi:hypothetical protein
MNVLFKRTVLHQVPNSAGTGAGTEPASDATIGIHHIFIGRGIQLFFTDGLLGTNGDANTAVPAGTAGCTLGAAVIEIRENRHPGIEIF